MCICVYTVFIQIGWKHTVGANCNVTVAFSHISLSFFSRVAAEVQCAWYCCFILEAEIMGLCVISLFLLGCSLTGCDIISSIVRGLPQLPGMLKRGNTYLLRDRKGFCLFLWLPLLLPSAGSLTIQADGEVENHTTSPRLEGFLLMGIFKEVPGNHELQFARTSFHFCVRVLVILVPGAFN